MLGQETAVLLLLCVGLLLLMAAVTNGAGFSLDGIKGRTVGDGQHGTARFAGKGGNTAHVPPGAVSAAGVETGKASSKGTRAGGGL